MSHSTELVGVLGAGTMGAGIAQALAQSGFSVLLYDVSEKILSAAEERIQRGLHRAEEPEAFSLIRNTTQLEPFSACDAVIEAVSEDLEIKHGLLRRLDPILEPGRLFATNTSSLSVAEIARASENPERVVGMHFFNPATVMRLVEIVAGERSSERSLSAAEELARAMGKTPVRCKDAPGFVANRVARPFYLTGMRLLEEGRGDPASIDRAVKELGGFRMGPLELIDLIGVEVNWTITRQIYEGLGRPERLRPRGIQKALVEKGFHGRKTACGFYVYGENPAGTVNPELKTLLPGMGREAWPAEKIFREVLDAVIGEARIAEKEKLASAEDIDLAMRLGLNWPKGPLAWSKEL